MSENFLELIEQYLPEENTNGGKLEAKLLRKDNEYAYLDVKDKLEARMKVEEVNDLEEGATFFVQVQGQDDDFIYVSKNLYDRNEALKSLNKGDIVKGKILKKTAQGFDVDLGKITAKLPIKYSGIYKNDELPNIDLEFEIIDKGRRGVILSRQRIIEKKEKEFFDKVDLGDILDGIVKEKLDFGLIVETDSIKGLVHLSELDWNNEKTLKNFKVGEEVKVKVIELDKLNKKIKFSIKQLSENPWLGIKNEYKIGQNFDAKIKEVFNFGVTVDLGNREGFIHISDLYYKKVNNANLEYSKGDVIFCEIIDFNDEKERISLSSKAVFDKIWSNIEEFYNVNDILNVKIIKVKDFGLFARTVDNLEVFIPKSEFSWNKEGNLKFKKHDLIDVKLIELNKDEKNIVGSIKRLGKSPWEIASVKFNKNEVYKLEVSDVIENGYLVKLTEDFKGLIPKKEVSRELQKGEEIEAMLIEKNPNKNSILFSVNKISELEEKKEMEELLKQYSVN